MPPFASFQKSVFRGLWDNLSGSLGTLRQGPWGPGEVEPDFFVKIFNGLDQTLPMIPHMPPFASFQKSRFSEVSGTLCRGPWGPGEVETEFFFKIFDGLDQTLPMTPLLLKLNGIDKSLEIPISPQISGNFRKIPEIFESPVAVD